MVAISVPSLTGVSRGYPLVPFRSQIITIVEPKTNAELLAAFEEHATVRLTIYNGEGPPKLSCWDAPRTR